MCVYVFVSHSSFVALEVCIMCVCLCVEGGSQSMFVALEVCMPCVEEKFAVTVHDFCLC